MTTDIWSDGITRKLSQTRLDRKDEIKFDSKPNCEEKKRQQENILPDWRPTLFEFFL